ncbi:ATP-dependent DNA helicase Pif1-like [Rhizophagus clarus]|uniref:ATP-dependent DNA helicase Pif1-like n=1 Tax=Rhizophagus clarus TaxID=94130 RepID=A0A8H3M486_9GLOM|nr:ATP-dependent DNA helicase Pif1-like [Rhizophagus clarus]
MNSETLKERQKMLQRERQQRCRHLKRQNGKKTYHHHIQKEGEMMELMNHQIPKACIYPWISDGLDCHTLGNMDHECFNCGAMMWLDERVNLSTRSPAVLATCCAKGKVLLPLLQKLLPPLDRLLNGMDSTACLFKQNIRCLPPHKLILKLGTPIILLRNMQPFDGICNGTRLVCRTFQKHVIEAEIITGNNSGTQFPVQPAFAMTINKSQRQTFNWVDLYLPTPVFSHGQLYVAFLRVTSRKNLKILISKRQGANVTYNVVYPEVFR